MNWRKTFLVFCVFCCGALTLGAAPYSFKANEQDKTPYLTEILVQKKPLRYSLKEGEPQLDKLIVTAFTSWFTNVTDRLDDAKRKELAPLLDVLYFAADPQHYVRSDSRHDISFYFKPSVSAACGAKAAGCFSSWAISIHILLSANGTPVSKSALAHEIGHALQMNDLYKGEIPPDGGYYSSVEKESIMNHSLAPTCDDADAIVNALYWAAQKVGRNLPDLHFTSFCQNGAVYHNGRMLNHPPVFYDRDGVRTLYTYCQDGRVREIWRVSPRDPNHFVEQVQAPLDCPAAPGTLPQKPFVPPATGNYEVRDFLTNRILQSHPSGPANGSATYFPFPAAGFTLAVHHGDAFAPRYGYAVNEKGHILYLFAFLSNGYNFVYDGDFEDDHFGYAAAVVYPRNNPQVFLAANGPREFNRFCQGTPAQCRALKKQQKEALAFFAKRYELPLKSTKDLQEVSYKEALRNAVRWEIFIRTRYPTLEMLSEPLPQ